MVLQPAVGPVGTIHVLVGDSGSGAASSVEVSAGSTATVCVTRQAARCLWLAAARWPTAVRAGSSSRGTGGSVSVSAGASADSVGGGVSVTSGASATLASGAVSVTSAEKVSSGAITLESGNSDGGGGLLSLRTGSSSSVKSASVALVSGASKASGAVVVSSAVDIAPCV